MDKHEYLLELEDISKHYPGVKALQNVNFKLKKGSVHALMGENGAGKSTLMKTIAGIVKPNEGIIKVEGENVEFSSPKASIDNGIAMIHQELSPVLDMTIAENIFLGREHNTKLGTIDYNAMNRESKQILDSLGINLSPKKLMSKLTVAQIQMVEIAKAISFNSQIIIMDEPTSAIANEEVEMLFSLINRFKEQGKGIIYTSHKMDEIYEIADEITVLRDGVYIGTEQTNRLPYDELIKMMVNRELKDIYPERNSNIGKTVLKVSDLSDGVNFEDVSFELKKGEILGVSGLLGAGRSEVMETVFGLRKKQSGTVFLNGEKVNFKNFKQAINAKIGFIPEDRKQQGLILERSVKENISLATLKSILKYNVFIDAAKEESLAKEYIKSLNVKTPKAEQQVGLLSGGNQQKVVLAKWLLISPQILIFDEPTKGVDIGAKTEIYKLINDLASSGVSIILISSELPEILGLSNRVIVLNQGKVAGEVSGDEITSEQIMTLATGSI